jgi:hypothetical protein
VASLIGVAWKPMLLAVPIFFVAAGLPFLHAMSAARSVKREPGQPRRRWIKYWTLTSIMHVHAAAGAIVREAEARADAMAASRCRRVLLPLAATLFHLERELAIRRRPAGRAGIRAAQPRRGRYGAAGISTAGTWNCAPASSARCASSLLSKNTGKASNSSVFAPGPRQRASRWR